MAFLFLLISTSFVTKIRLRISSLYSDQTICTTPQRIGLKLLS